MSTETMTPEESVKQKRAEWRSWTLLRALYAHDRQMTMRAKRTKDSSKRVSMAMERGDIQEAARDILKDMPNDEHTQPYRKYFGMRD